VSLIRTKNSLIIDLIAVGKNYRGKGIGGKLVAECQKIAFGLNLELFVGTQTDNPSNLLYSNLGFKKHSEYFVLHDIQR
jgi:predicted GNAT family acetyltransferase